MAHGLIMASIGQKEGSYEENLIHPEQSYSVVKWKHFFVNRTWISWLLVRSLNQSYGRRGDFEFTREQISNYPFPAPKYWLLIGRVTDVPTIEREGNIFEGRKHNFPKIKPRRRKRAWFRQKKVLNLIRLQVLKLGF